MKDIVIDTLLDGIKLIPFLFIAFLFIELIEHKFSDKTKKVISKSGRFGPIIGGLLGAVPQCGFSVIATNLYVTRIVTIGTLFAIYLSTSDEMIPILLSHQVSLPSILKIVGLKVVIGIIIGLIIDLIITKKNKNDFHICDESECHCEESLILSAITHTLKTIVFIILITFLLNCAFSYLDQEVIKNFCLSHSYLSSFITSLIGLIPNCGASIMITELYVNNVLSLGATMSGLLTGSGVALLVLFKSNDNLKENIKILVSLYGIGVIAGILIDVIGNIL